MTAQVTSKKIETAIRAAAEAHWPGPVEIDLRTGVVRLLPLTTQTGQTEPVVNLDLVNWK